MAGAPGGLGVSRINPNGEPDVMSGIQTMTTYMATGAGARGRLLHGLLLSMIMLLAVWQTGAQAEDAGPQLEGVTFSTLAGNRVQVEVVMSAPVHEPRSFTTDTPARIALDFTSTPSNLSKKTQAIGVGAVRGVAAVQGKDRTRVVVDLVKMVPYQTRIEGNRFYLTLEGGDSTMTAASGAGATSAT